jgi:hypothetical protein
MSSNPWETDEALKESLRGHRIASPQAAIGPRGTWVDALHATACRRRSTPGMQTAFKNLTEMIRDPQGSGTVDRLAVNPSDSFRRLK